jgi:hydroxyacylglutathione hydrolase
MIDFTVCSPVTGDLDVRWVHGSRPGGLRTDPAVQVHWYDPHTAVLRQSKDVTFEAPFVFLLFGNQRALLLDTGATKDDSIRTQVDALIDQWRSRNLRPEYPLVVAHTHGHTDHRAGDAAFIERPDTTLLATDSAAVAAFFEFVNWPVDVVQFDLGGRIVDITGIPGHHPASIALYDPWTGILFTGDSVMPARLYVEDMATFSDSLKRLVAFSPQRHVTHVFGCHVKMTRTPGRDYYPGCRDQPEEVAPTMTPAQLRTVQAAVASVKDRPGIHTFDDVILYNGMSPMMQARLAARGIAGTVRSRLRANR